MTHIACLDARRGNARIASVQRRASSRGTAFVQKRAEEKPTAPPRYDGNVTTFSPEGRLHQVEYAVEAINNAGTAVGLLATDGVIMAGEKQKATKLLDPPKSSEKIYKLDDHLATVVAGLTADANILINEARLAAQRYRYQYGEPMPVEQLVEKVCNHKQLYTQWGAARKVARRRPRLVGDSRRRRRGRNASSTRVEAGRPCLDARRGVPETVERQKRVLGARRGELPQDASHLGTAASGPSASSSSSRASTTTSATSCTCRTRAATTAAGRRRAWARTPTPASRC